MKTFSFVTTSKTSFYFSLVFFLSLYKNQKSKIRRFKMTMLKSPHANKSSQEQFEFKMIKYSRDFHFLQRFKPIFSLKSFYDTIDATIKFVHISSKWTLKNLGFHSFTPNNNTQWNQCIFSSNLKTQLKYFKQRVFYNTNVLLKAIASFGEFCIMLDLNINNKYKNR